MYSLYCALQKQLNSCSMSSMAVYGRSKRFLNVKMQIKYLHRCVFTPGPVLKCITVNFVINIVIGLHHFLHRS